MAGTIGLRESGEGLTVDKIDAPGRRVPHFPSGRQRARHRRFTKVSRDPRIVPRTNARAYVIEIHLALARLAYFVAIRQICR